LILIQSSCIFSTRLKVLLISAAAVAAAVAAKCS